MKKFIKDLFTDFEDHWDLKPILGFLAFIFGFYFIGWLNKGDVAGFASIEAIAAFLLGWAASPWGAGDPRKKTMGAISLNCDPPAQVPPASEAPAKDGA
jgi:hypothetical protein